MGGPVDALLPDGRRLHLQHGPIDLVIGVDGDRDRAFGAAVARFATILDELVAELPLLRQADGPRPEGAVARRMHDAIAPHRAKVFVTPMAAVAGAVADEVLAAMRAAMQATIPATIPAAIPGAVRLDRAYVNNGGDIALYLAPGQSFRLAVASPANRALGVLELVAADGIGGVATSGQGGRSLSMGIADAVTVLAATAAGADAAATLIANAVDLPGHPAVRRMAASRLQPDSDLGDRAVVTGVGDLSPAEVAEALDRGLEVAQAMRRAGLIAGAGLFLRGQARATEGAAGLAVGGPAGLAGDGAVMPGPAGQRGVQHA
jgi:ApbE superfamily uncharacterized protein (UPF0280 family)